MATSSARGLWVAAVWAWLAAVALAQPPREVPATAQRAAAAQAVAKKPRPGAGLTVLARSKLGSYIEDATYVRRGPHAHHIVFVDGYAVRAVAARAGADAAIETLFDVRDQPFLEAVRGIAWLEGEQAYAYVDAGQPGWLFMSDAKGRALPPRPTRYGSTCVPEWVDGLETIAPDAAQFPGHLVIVANRYDEAAGTYRPCFVVLRPDGQAVAEIDTPLDWAQNHFHNFGYGVAPLASGHLLVSYDFGWGILGLDGTPVARGDAEEPYADGLVQVDDRRVVVTDGARLRFYDAAHGGRVGDERFAGSGAGIVYPRSVLAGPAEGGVAALAFAEATGSEGVGIWQLDATLGHADRRVDLAPMLFRLRGATFVPTEQRYAVTMRARSGNPPELFFYDLAGTLVERLDLAGAMAGLGAPQSVAFMADRYLFAIKGSASPSRLRLFDRLGALQGELDFAGLGLGSVWAFAYAAPTASRGARFVIADWLGTRLVVVDEGGLVHAEIDYRRALGIVEPVPMAVLQGGRWDGALAIADEGTSELVVLRLPGL